MKSIRQSKEPQYQVQFDTMQAKGPVNLGPTASHLYRSDPRHLAFLLARYKFVAKMLAGMSRVLEVGCGDAFGMAVVLQEVGHVHGVDFDRSFVEWAQQRAAIEQLDCTFSVLDIVEGSPGGGDFDAAYALDLIEHIEKAQEQTCMKNICKALSAHGVCILGTPNVTSNTHASQWSKEGHVNLHSAGTLRGLMASHFHNVFIFSMNDEVVHTGFYPMAHYLFGIGAGVRQ